MSIIIRVAKQAGLNVVLKLISEIDRDTQKAKVWVEGFAKRVEREVEAAFAVYKRDEDLEPRQIQYVEKAKKKFLTALADFKKAPSEETAFKLSMVANEFHNDAFDPEAEEAEFEVLHGQGESDPSPRSQPVLRAFAKAQVTAGNTVVNFMGKFKDRVDNIVNEVAPIILSSLKEEKWVPLLESFTEAKKKAKKDNVFVTLDAYKKVLEKLRSHLVEQAA